MKGLPSVGRGERGEAAALELMLVVGLLLLPALIGIAQIPRWVDAKSTGELAAQEAARRMALAADPDTGVAAATALARTIVTNHGWPASTLRGVELEGSLAPGSAVTARVTLEVPAIVVPLVGRVGGGMARSWEHTEIVDDFREW